MDKSIHAHFDGNVIVPDEPLGLSAGQRIQIQIKLENNGNSRFDGLRNLATDLGDTPADLAHQHDHYLYGTNKK